MLEEKAEGIKLAWENAKKGRDVISELATFPEIADLTEEFNSCETYPRFLVPLNRMANTYGVYSIMQSTQGNEQTAVRELITMDSVIRKLNVNARCMLTKLICTGCLVRNFAKANFIVNNPQTSEISLELLAHHFRPLNEEQISLRNCFISEYFGFKDIIENDKILTYADDYADEDIPDWYKFFYKHTAKRNATVRLFRNHINRLIEKEAGADKNKTGELSIWPKIFQNLPSIQSDLNDFHPRDYYYHCLYNPGWIQAGLMASPMNKFSEVRTKLQIYDDLFQIVLNKRLGREVSLKARAYSDEYIVDVEKKLIFSPGPDGEPYTKDDIKLLINPEVIGFGPE